MKFAFIHGKRAYFPIFALCRVLDVTRTGYHAWAVRKPCTRACEDRVLAAQITAVFTRSRQTYGSPRVLMELREQNLSSFDKCIGRRRTARIMQENRLFARRRKAFRRCPATCDVARVAENLLARDFSASTPNSVWVTDVKYVQTDQGWLYLAPVLDLFLRHIIDRAMSEAHDGALARAAIGNAVATRIRNRTLRMHSDRGSIYGEHEYVQRLSTLGIERSMSRASNPWDNAAMGSFFSTLQFELLSRNRFEKLEDARAAITEWIDVFITPNPDKRRVVERVRSNTNCVGRCVSRGHNQPVHESGANSLSRVKTSHPIVDESVWKPH